MTLKEISKTFRSIADAIDTLLGLDTQLAKTYTGSVAKELIAESGLVRRKKAKKSRKLSAKARKAISRRMKAMWKQKKAGEA